MGKWDAFTKRKSKTLLEDAPPAKKVRTSISRKGYKDVHAKRKSKYFDDIEAPQKSQSSSKKPSKPISKTLNSNRTQQNQKPQQRKQPSSIDSQNLQHRKKPKVDANKTTLKAAGSGGWFKSIIAENRQRQSMGRNEGSFKSNYNAYSKSKSSQKGLTNGKNQQLNSSAVGSQLSRSIEKRIPTRSKPIVKSENKSQLLSRNNKIAKSTPINTNKLKPSFQQSRKVRTESPIQPIDFSDFQEKHVPFFKKSILLSQDSTAPSVGLTQSQGSITPLQSQSLEAPKKRKSFTFGSSKKLPTLNSSQSGMKRKSIQNSMPQPPPKRKSFGRRTSNTEVPSKKTFGTTFRKPKILKEANPFSQGSKAFQTQTEYSQNRIRLTPFAKKSKPLPTLPATRPSMNNRETNVSKSSAFSSTQSERLNYFESLSPPKEKQKPAIKIPVRNDAYRHMFKKKRLSDSRRSTPLVQKCESPQLFSQSPVEPSKSGISFSDADFGSHLLLLNEKQRDAVKATENAISIVASPGSGKTRTLTTRIAYFIHNGIPPERIVGLTFTRAAAKEMEVRVQRLLGVGLMNDITICNFHQLSLRVLREEYASLGLKKDFQVMDTAGQRKKVKEAIAIVERKNQKIQVHGSDQSSSFADAVRCDASAQMQEDIMDEDLDANEWVRDKKQKLVSHFLNYIHRQKQTGVPAHECPDLYMQVYQTYNELMMQDHAIDFNDMVPLCRELFRVRKPILEKYQRRFRYFFVDEFQDVSAKQFGLLKLLLGNRNAGDEGYVTVCGDDDQSIYGWRGSLSHSFQVFMDSFPRKSREIILGQTYRSSEILVSAFSSLICRNKQRRSKKIWTQNESGTKIEIRCCSTDQMESRIITEQILTLRQEGIGWNEIAILGRTRWAIKDMNKILTEAGVPTGKGTMAQQFFRDEHISLLMDYMHMILQPHDSARFLSVINKPARGISNKSIQIIKDLQSKRNISAFDATQQVGNGAMKVTKKARENIKRFIFLFRKLRTFAATTNSMQSIVRKIIEEIKYMEFVKTVYVKKRKTMHKILKNIEKLNTFTEDYDRNHMRDNQLQNPGRNQRSIQENLQKNGLPMFLGGLGSFMQQEASQKEDKICINTIHQSKGREWEYVFIKGFNEGILPLNPPRKYPQQSSEEYSKVVASHFEEERRLAYVSLSRAKKQVYVSFHSNNQQQGPSVPSRFLDEIPKKFVVHQLARIDVAE